MSSYCLPMRMCSFIMPWRTSRLIRYHSAVLAKGYMTRYFMRVSANGSISCGERTLVYCEGRVKPHNESTGRIRDRYGVVTCASFSKKAEVLHFSFASRAHQTSTSALLSVF